MVSEKKREYLKQRYLNQKKINGAENIDKRKELLIIPDEIQARAKEMYDLGVMKKNIIRNIGFFLVKEKQHTLNYKSLNNILVA